MQRKPGEKLDEYLTTEGEATFVTPFLNDDEIHETYIYADYDKIGHCDGHGSITTDEGSENFDIGDAIVHIPGAGKWLNYYESFYLFEYNEEKRKTFDWDTFDKHGKIIAEKLRRLLPDNYEIHFHNELIEKK